MSRLSVQLQYDKKVAELRTLVEKEAKNLHDVLDSKILATSEVKELGERKATLGRILIDLETRIKEKQEGLDQLIEKELVVPQSIAAETKKESVSLLERKESLDKINESIKELNPVAVELEDFIKKESNARLRYIEESKKADDSEKKYKEFLTKTQQERASFENKNKELDAYKNYLVDLYGKMASYVGVMRETLEYVNEELKKTNTPIKFNLPPGEIIEIDFNNFTKKYEQA